MSGIIRNCQPHLLAADFMKNRDGYAGVEMEGCGPLPSIPKIAVDGVRLSLETVSKKIAALKAMSDVEFGELKKVKILTKSCRDSVVLEQTMRTFGYREIQVFERELGAGLIIEKGIPSR